MMRLIARRPRALWHRREICRQDRISLRIAAVTLCPDVEHELGRIRDAAAAIPSRDNLPMGNRRPRGEFARFHHLEVAGVIDVANAIARPQRRLLW